MNVTVLNINSEFDWCGGVRHLLGTLDGNGIAARLGVPAMAEVVETRLGGLRFVLLISGALMQKACAQNPGGEGGQGQPGRKSLDNLPFRQRRGGGFESVFYRMPRRHAGGGVTEPFGIYTRDARGYLEGLVEAGPDDSGGAQRDTATAPRSRAPLAPSDIGHEPAIILSPERLFGLPGELVRSLAAGEPRPEAGYSSLFLAMTLYHELGHHVFAADPSHDPYVAEGLANHFCEALLDDAERPWLFAKAWLLQPSPYLAYFFPRILEEMGAAPAGVFWRKMVLRALGTGGTGSPCLGGDFGGQGNRVERMVVSPQALLAGSGLAAGVNDGLAQKRLEALDPCAIGPFEEYGCFWAQDSGLIRLLGHGEPSVLRACYDYASLLLRLVDSQDRRSALEEALQNWSDRNVGSPDPELALRAWRHPSMHRKRGREGRYRVAIASPNSAVAREVARAAARNLPPRAAAAILIEAVADARAEVGVSAATEFATLVAGGGWEAEIEEVVRKGGAVATRTLWDSVPGIAARLPENVLEQLAGRKHPATEFPPPPDDEERSRSIVVAAATELARRKLWAQDDTLADTLHRTLQSFECRDVVPAMLQGLTSPTCDVPGGRLWDLVLRLGSASWLAEWRAATAKDLVLPFFERAVARMDEAEIRAALSSLVATTCRDAWAIGSALPLLASRLSRDEARTMLRTMALSNRGELCVPAAMLLKSYGAYDDPFVESLVKAHCAPGRSAAAADVITTMLRDHVTPSGGLGLGFETLQGVCLRVGLARDVARAIPRDVMGALTGAMVGLLSACDPAAREWWLVSIVTRAEFFPEIAYPVLEGMDREAKARVLGNWICERAALRPWALSLAKEWGAPSPQQVEELLKAGLDKATP